MTPDQRELLVFIGHYAAENGGLAPTYNEMKEGLGGASNSVYWRRVDRLIAGGYLRRAKAKTYSRSIYLTDQGREYLGEVGAFDRIKAKAAKSVLEGILEIATRYDEPGIEVAYVANLIERNSDDLIEAAING